jgi:putative restriction endonuclease
MRIYIGITDFNWYQFLSVRPVLDEVNFWQPTATGQFRALSSGEPFLFKLHSPKDYIVGGGFFAHYSELPVSLAWNAFEAKNGASSLTEMRHRIEHYRRSSTTAEDYKIGCILLEQPFFFPQEDWLSVPENWSSSIVRGKGYETEEPVGRDLWEKVKLRLQLRKRDPDKLIGVAEERARYGSPVITMPRLGQGSFRIIVLDVYNRRCAVTEEKTLPALEASHIKPYNENGPHHVQNGILLRADIHKLLDAGYGTISPDYHFEVSRKIEVDFDNGKNYYSLHGKQLCVPERIDLRPSQEFISWHNENVFRG